MVSNREHTETGTPGTKARDGSRRKESRPAFDPARCKSCGICINFCPKQALRWGPDGHPEIADPEACNACGLCERMCPDFAIRLTEQPADEDPEADENREAAGDEAESGR